MRSNLWELAPRKELRTEKLREQQLAQVETAQEQTVPTKNAQEQAVPMDTETAEL